MFLMHFHRPKDKKLIFNFFISVNRDSSERHVRQIFHQWFLVVGNVFIDTSFRLRYAHVYIQCFRLLRPSPVWRSVTSFASHAMGLRRACSHEPGIVNYPGVMIAPGQVLLRVHMMICCRSTSLPRGKFNVI